MFSVVINNYNYAHYLKEAIDSVLNQTYKNFELIIVDDGSTDNSREIIDQYEDTRIVRVYKENAGQLSCFNAALPYINGDIVTFLDSDDRYKNNYLEEIRILYTNNPEYDFISVNRDYFGVVDIPNFETVYNPFYYKNSSLKDTSFIVRNKYYFIGGACSQNSIKVTMLKKILPYQHESDWKIRADDILVWGASLHHAHKFIDVRSLIEYRAHSKNRFYGTDTSSDFAKMEEYRMRREKYFSNFPYEKRTFSNILKAYIISGLPFFIYYNLLDDNVSSNIFLKSLQKLYILYLSVKNRKHLKIALKYQ